ncbi:MAG: EAL domain-containing protein [Nitratireductor sp.]|nr:EAL domain-containing protein [Nitratireductor sp.]
MLSAAVTALTPFVANLLHRGKQDVFDETTGFDAPAGGLLESLRAEAEAKGRDGADKIVTLSYTDKATGLGNKARFVEKFNNLVQAYTLAREEDRKPFAVGIMNLDGMKPINDLFGFSGGDALIAQCASRLRAALEEYGFVYRHDGDEFAIILPEVSTKEEIERIGKLLQEIIAAPFDIDGSTARLSGSMGFAIYPDAGETMERISAAFGTALYHSKRKGRSRLTVYSSEIERTVRENAILEQALRRAISENMITPHFQPIISLQDGSLLGFEALARWIDPEHGFVSPGRFVPLAEERGIITPLTEALLLQAARAAADWPDDLFLSFNLSSAQLVDPTTASAILETIRRAGLPPRRLEIEVTETAIMSDPETAARILAELHEAGVRISMDDFGTGQSSLGRLRELQLDKVKIDRAFISALAEDRPAQHIVRAILEMCAGLDLTVVAEGIEEVNQAESLKRFGCHAGQGYLFGKPQDAVRTMGYIREFRRIAKSDREAKVA